MLKIQKINDLIKHIEGLKDRQKVLLDRLKLSNAIKELWQGDPWADGEVSVALSGHVGKADIKSDDKLSAVKLLIMAGAERKTFPLSDVPEVLRNHHLDRYPSMRSAWNKWYGKSKKRRGCDDKNTDQEVAQSCEDRPIS